MEIIDNFLPKVIFSSIQEMFFREDFPWFWNDKKVDGGLSCDEIDNYQFIHTFYSEHSRHSNWNIEPIINLLNPKAIVRVKANLNPKTSKIIKYGFHVDTNFECKTAIYYVNSNNGFTEFSDGKIVNSIENRMIIFNSSNAHTGTSCTDQKRRIVLNLNYF